MTDRVHPSAKPTATATAANPSFPATKGQLYGATRPTYRPQSTHRRSSRSCCCTLCFWLILILLFLLILLGAAGTVLYYLYRPHRPSFSVTSLKLTSLKLSPSSSALTSNFDLTLSATNPNNKIVFFYQPTSVSILAGDVDVGDGTIPAFEHVEKNTTLLEALVSKSGEVVEGDAGTMLKESLKSKSGLALKVKMETKVEAKMSVFKTPRVGIRVLCDGIDVALPAGEKPATASTTDAKCEVDVRFKVWKWTLG
ncbi:Late embryogenesis abundant protein [Sesbania bispinosa]|nr:Late embryogenesis abundant protein [Sesbania bispinosa]